jgi:hypothetical protein
MYDLSQDKVAGVTKVLRVLRVIIKITLITPDFRHLSHFFLANLVRKSFDNWSTLSIIAV